MRFADDFVACFEEEADARRFIEALKERLAAFDLEVEPTKTAVLRFGSKAERDSHQDGLRRPKTFNFLGITHFVSHSRKGNFAVGRKTERKRFSTKLKRLDEMLRKLRLDGGKAMMTYVQQHLRGHIQYYGVSGNIRSLRRYYYVCCRLLFKWLNRRSQRRSVNWQRYGAIVKHWMPRVRIVHNLYPTPWWKTQAGSRMV